MKSFFVLLLTFSVSRADDLASRYSKLSCAVVKVTYEGGSGTAFFTNAHGGITTVAHVLYDKTFKLLGNTVTAEVKPKKGLMFLTSDGKSYSALATALNVDEGRRALFDLATMESGIASPCFIPLGDSDNVRIGEHLIAIGFPGTAVSSVLYEGFLSSRHSRLPLSFGPIEGRPDLAYAPTYEVLRVQMPITPGASGSPIIDDQNTAVGVVSEVPVILTNDVVKIAEAFGGMRNVSSGVQLSGFDVTKTLGELSWIVSQFETPGSGLAVPVNFLKAPNFSHLPKKLSVPGVPTIPKPSIFARPPQSLSPSAPHH